MFYRDLTDKIAADERIRHAEKMEAVGQLTGGVAHDFNNILTVITGTIEILADAVAKEPELAAITKMIDEAAGRGAELTQHLLAFARKQPLQPREIDVNALIIDTAKLLRPTLGEQIHIESVFEDESCVATVDPSQLTTAILNLALNARDAMPGGGKLIVETGAAYLDEVYASVNDVPPGHYVLIAVSDTGSGIPANMLARVFDPFFTSKGPGKGTGLGLSMVYGFIKQSAGHIKIYSEEDHGTTIKMYLPPGKTPTVVGEERDAGDDRGRTRDDPGGRGRPAGARLRAGAAAFARLRHLAGGERRGGARNRRRRKTVRPPVHRRHHARQDERTAARRRTAENASRSQGALHVRLYRERDHPSRPAGFGRSAAGEALS